MVVNILVKSTVMCVNLDIDDPPISSHSHTQPSHSQSVWDFSTEIWSYVLSLTQIPRFDVSPPLPLTLSGIINTISCRSVEKKSHVVRSLHNTFRWERSPGILPQQWTNSVLQQQNENCRCIVPNFINDSFCTHSFCDSLVLNPRLSTGPSQLFEFSRNCETFSVREWMSFLKNHEKGTIVSIYLIGQKSWHLFECETWIPTQFILNES